MTRERKMAVAGAGFIVVAAVALSSVNYLKSTAFWTLIGIGTASFVIGVCLYFYAIWRQRKLDRQSGAGSSGGPSRRPGGRQ